VTALQCAATLILARHGEAEYEVDEWADEGGSLTPRGRQQAAALGDSLAGRRVAHVWTSTYARAVQTGEIAAARLGVAVTTRTALCEFRLGDLVGHPKDLAALATSYHAWLDGDLDARIAGSESGHELVARARAVLQEIADAHPGETVLVVTHGGVIRVAVPALCRMDDITPAELDNVGHVELLVDADDWVCTRWGVAD
jgi:2,3-bisphosphoglycerate-dependent phosphoglycerate mutase